MIDLWLMIWLWPISITYSLLQIHIANVIRIVLASVYNLYGFGYNDWIQLVKQFTTCVYVCLCVCVFLFVIAAIAHALIASLNPSNQICQTWIETFDHTTKLIATQWFIGGFQNHTTIIALYEIKRTNGIAYVLHKVTCY